MASVRAFFFSRIVLLFFLLTFSWPAGAYSVLSHEALIDLTWNDSIRPLLLKRYPNLTPAQLKEAHAYAYGGCLIQDLGYYPFEKARFSNLLHYVRTADFIRALFRDSKDADDLAFSIGALAHYLGDTVGHANAVNLAVANEFPDLAAKYGRNVNYAEGMHEHVRVEFAFDVNDIVKHRIAPEKYLNHIGFAVPMPLLAKAFYDTYGLDLAKVLKQPRPQVRGYRYAVRTLLPHVAYAEALLHRHEMHPDTPSPALDALNAEIKEVAAQDNWASYRGYAGFGTHVLAGIIYVLPKFGPLAPLAVRIPTPASEQDYVNAFVLTADTLRGRLAQAARTDTLPNKDLDTGDLVYPGTYSLEDYAYADLLHQMTLDPGSPIPFGIKRDLIAYFADPAKVKYVQGNRKLQAQVNADLPVLKNISTKAEYPESALLPEPDADKPNPTEPTATKTPESGDSSAAAGDSVAPVAAPGSTRPSQAAAPAPKY